MSVYFEYLAERRPEMMVKTVPEGFAIYRYMEDAVYIEEIYVKPEYRNTSIASQLSEEIQSEALELGYTQLLGSVSPSAQRATQSIQVLIAHGMQVTSAEDDLIWFFKDLKENI